MKIKNLKTTILFTAMLTSIGANAYQEENHAVKEKSYIIKIDNGYNQNDLISDLDNINGLNFKQKRRLIENYFVVNFTIEYDFDYLADINRLRSVVEVEENLMIRPNSLNYKSEPLYALQYYMLSRQDSGNLGSSSIEFVRDNTSMPNRLPNNPNDMEIINNRPTIAILDTGILEHNAVHLNNIVAGYKFSSVYLTKNFYTPTSSGGDRVRSSFFDIGSNYEDFNEYRYIREEVIDGETVTLNDYASCVSSHGTSMAGLISAPIINEGIAGIGDFNLMIGKVLDTDCSPKGLGTRGQIADLVEGIRWASRASIDDPLDTNVIYHNKPADVILISSSTFGEDVSCPSALQLSIDQAVSRGSIVVASAGNDSGSVSATVPANCDNVITIGSNDINGNRSSFSNRGANYLDFSVLGENIYVPEISSPNINIKDEYEIINGTSASAAIFSGMVGLLKYSFNNFDSGTIKNIIGANIDSMNNGSDCVNNSCGKGVVDLERVFEDINIQTNFSRTTNNYFGFSEEGTCERFIQKAVSEYLDICSVYTIEISNDNEQEGFSYKLFRADNDENLWSFGNSENANNVVIEGEYKIVESNIDENKTLYLSDLDLDSYKYAVSYCSEDFCYPLHDLDFSNLEEENIPLECR